MRALTVGNKLPSLTHERLDRAINFLLKSGLLDEYDRELCSEIFKKYGVSERGEVSLQLNEKLKKKLVSSVGKLKSIAEITGCEAEDRGGELRLLILTDYIKKESLSVIGSREQPDSVSIVSVFETVRKTGVSVGALSGSLVILPDICADKLRAERVQFEKSPLGDTGYSVYDFRADNREKVGIVGALFEKGVINVLVGTKSLLGEGWDAPCVNSLILASFVGSFMLSNQMRGRAIRTYPRQPDKTAAIWHLVTVERPCIYAEGVLDKINCIVNDNTNKLVSCDYETVSSRFDCFVAPNYETGEIESGISRVSLIKPPYDSKGVERINREMIKLSRKREELRLTWQDAVSVSSTLNEVSSISKEKRTPPFVFLNIALAAFLLSLFGTGIAVIISIFFQALVLSDVYRLPVIILTFLICFIAAVLFSRLLNNKILTHLNPVRSVRTLAKCILKAMQELKLVSDRAQVKVESDDKGILIVTELINASVHDQNIFHTAMKEMLSPIENPRYVLIPYGRLGNARYKYALACPEILGSKNEYAECLADKLKRSMGRMEAVYTRTEKGRKLIMTCRKSSYITYNAETIYEINKRISRWE